MVHDTQAYRKVDVTQHHSQIDYILVRKRFQSGVNIARIQIKQRLPDHCKETQTVVVWSCLSFIRSRQNHLAKHSETEKKTRQTEEEVERQHQGMDRPGVCRVPEGSGEQGKMEKTGCKIICGTPTTLVVKGLMMMIKSCVKGLG